MKQPKIRFPSKTLVEYFGFKPNEIPKGDPVAHEQNELFVGKWYTVAHAVIKNLHSGNLHLTPVFPFLHSDKQFTPAPAHLHVDGRYGSKHYYIDFHYGKKTFATNEAVFVTDGKRLANGNKFLGLVYVRRKCARTKTGLDFGASVANKPPKKWLVWQKSMVGKSCAGKKCPHYGTAMIKQGEHLFCPMHNLVACAKTEKILDYESTRFVQPFAEMQVQVQ